MFVNDTTASKDDVCNATAYKPSMEKKTTAAKLSMFIVSPFESHAIGPTKVWMQAESLHLHACAFPV